jgi:hypothetical protein
MSLILFCWGGNVSLVIEASFDFRCFAWFKDWSVSTGVDNEDGLVFISDDDGLDEAPF